MDERAFEQRVLELEPRLYRTACAILWNDADAADALRLMILHFSQMGFTDGRTFMGKSSLLELSLSAFEMEGLLCLAAPGDAAPR